MDAYTSHVYGWCTSKELSFIDDLINNKSGCRKKKTLAEIKTTLKGYIRSCKNRAVWTGVNAKKAEQYAQTKLAEL